MVFARDCDDLKDALPPWSPFQVLTSSDLELPLGAADTSALDDAEHREIAYWRPETVGELLFNYWD